MVFRPSPASAPQTGLYESDWTKIAAAGSATFTHELGEVPISVDVLRSSYSDGSSPTDPNADISGGVTVAKSTTTVTVTNDNPAGFYFQVRAL